MSEKLLYDLYRKYLVLWNIDHQEGESICFQEFCDNEAKDPDVIAEIEMRWNEGAWNH